MPADSELLSAARDVLRLCFLPSAAVTAVCSCPGRFGTLLFSRRGYVGYPLSEHIWPPGWGRRELWWCARGTLVELQPVLREAGLKNRSTQLAGWVCQDFSSLEDHSLAQPFRH